MQVLPNRQSIRLKWFDYSSSAIYFVTICTYKHSHFFGHIANGRMYPNEAGNTAREVWLSIPDRFPGVQLDEFIFMPNHVHMLLFVYNRTNVTNMPQRFQAHMQALMEDRRPELQDPYKPAELWEILKHLKRPQHVSFASQVSTSTPGKSVIGTKLY